MWSDAWNFSSSSFFFFFWWARARVTNQYGSSLCSCAPAIAKTVEIWPTAALISLHHRSPAVTVSKCFPTLMQPALPGAVSNYWPSRSVLREATCTAGTGRLPTNGCRPDKISPACKRGRYKIFHCDSRMNCVQTLWCCVSVPYLSSHSSQNTCSNTYPSFLALCCPEFCREDNVECRSVA